MTGKGIARRLSRRRWLVTAVSVLVVGAVASIGSVSAGSTSGGSTRSERSSPARITAAELQVVFRAASAARASASRLTAQDALPTCTEPALPSPSPLPPNGVHGYEVPFVAALTGAQIAAGYNAWIANRTTYTVGSRTYTFYPWSSSVEGVSGWVSGYLDLPGLTAEVPASNIEFCDQGGTACFDAAPPPGQCIMFGLGQGGALLPGEQPNESENGFPLEAAPLSGPTSCVPPPCSGTTLAPNQSGVYTFTTNVRAIHAGITTQLFGDGPGGPVQAIGTTYYNGFPWDAYSGQFVKVSKVTVNGKAADTAPGPVVPPGSTYTIAGTVTDTSATQPVGLNAIGPFGGAPPSFLSLKPGQSKPFSFTGTAQAGAQDVMVRVEGLASEPAGVEAVAGGFGAAYYQGGAVAGGLSLSNQQILVGGQWVPASAAPGPDIPASTQLPGTAFTSQVTVTNTTHSTITNITGNTTAESCWQFGLCTKFLVTLTPEGVATLKVSGVEPDGALDVTGSASTLTTVNDYYTPTFFTTSQQVAPTSVVISTKDGGIVPSPPGPPAPTPANPDYRGLQFTPQGLHGPLLSGSATVAGNDFAVPAFDGPLASILNPTISGWNTDGVANYPACPLDDPTCGGTIAGQPGWNQFSADTVVVKVGVPVGVPPGFSWTPPTP